MSTKPILFNSEMVRALLDGRKTVTRRVVKPQPHGKMSPMPMVDEWPNYWRDESPDRLFTPPYHPDDILYVRETWAKIRTPGDGERYVYEATDQYPFVESYVVKFRWHPSIHMPRGAARIFLRVKAVRADQLQSITPEDIFREGIQADYYIPAFHDLWDSTVKPAGRSLYGWAANPWVWVIEFELISREEAGGDA